MDIFSSLFEGAVHFLISFILQIGYTGIFIGMFLESTAIPVPSELVMIPAGMAAAQGEMSLILVLLVGVAGNVAGAVASYYLAEFVGRAILFRVGKYFFLKPEVIIKMENFFNRHGEISVFIGRLIPGFRHFISLPAGVAKMNIKTFCIYTFAGSAIWTTVLTILGYFIGKNHEMIKEYLHLTVLGAVAFCAVLVFVYVAVKKGWVKKMFVRNVNYN